MRLVTFVHAFGSIHCASSAYQNEPTRRSRYTTTHTHHNTTHAEPSISSLRITRQRSGRCRKSASHSLYRTLLPTVHFRHTEPETESQHVCVRVPQRPTAILRDISTGNQLPAVRLVFRPHTTVARSICTSESLRASTGVSTGFTPLKYRSPPFGIQCHGLARRRCELDSSCTSPQPKRTPIQNNKLAPT